jgi:hypothetical protein
MAPLWPQCFEPIVPAFTRGHRPSIIISCFIIIFYNIAYTIVYRLVSSPASARTVCIMIHDYYQGLASASASINGISLSFIFYFTTHPNPPILSKITLVLDSFQVWECFTLIIYVKSKILVCPCLPASFSTSQEQSELNTYYYQHLF